MDQYTYRYAVANKSKPEYGYQSKKYAPNSKQNKHEVGLEAWIYMFKWIKPYIHDCSPRVNYEDYEPSKNIRFFYHSNFTLIKVDHLS